MTLPLSKMLVVDKDQDFLKAVRLNLAPKYDVETSLNGNDGLTLFKSFKPDVVMVENEVKDISFDDLLGEIKNIDQGVVRLVVSRDFSNIEAVIDAINENKAHKYLRKPVNFAELGRIIAGLTADHQGGEFSSAKAKSVYSKLSTILDKVKKAEGMEKEAAAQLAKAAASESESLEKMRQFQNAVKEKTERINELQQVIMDLNNRVDETSLKNRKTEDELRKLKDDFEEQAKNNQKANDALKELEISMEVSKDEAITISEDIKITREKKGGKDSILFVDDENNIRDTVKSLYGDDYNLYIADGHTKAMELLNANPDINIVLTDQRMPEVTGIELAAKIRKLKPDMPIFLVTAYADLDDAIQAMNKGYITKYFDKDKLVDPATFPDEIKVGVEKYDEVVAQKEIITGKKTFIVDRIKSLSADLKKMQYEVGRFKEEGTRATSKFHKTAAELEEAKKENSDLRVSVAKERQGMLEDMKQEREKFVAEMEKLKKDADRIVEVQRQKNAAELKKLQEELEQDKQKAQEALVRAEEEKQAVFKQIEEERKKMEAEQAATRQNMKEEQEAMKQRLAEEQKEALQKLEAEKKDAENKLAAEKKAAEEEIKKVRDGLEGRKKEVEAELEKELDKKRQEADAEIQKLKDEVTRDINKVKDALKEKEKALTLMAEQHKAMQKDIEKAGKERDQAKQEIAGMKEAYDLAIQSREALEMEIAELRG
ncbi:MAG: response regulator [Deltaproteobacteria bacterium]|nr:response regulator [Deltaproteobacteria bacterium]